jgi:hypothetical protein
MQIFIDNEEVLCSQKMTIKEQLSNTSSVILNNVYPKSWENDKDYVSRFYMPKDYSHCIITDDNIQNEVSYKKTTTEIEFETLENAEIDALNKIVEREGSTIEYIKVNKNNKTKLYIESIIPNTYTNSRIGGTNTVPAVGVKINELQSVEAETWTNEITGYEYIILTSFTSKVEVTKQEETIETTNNIVFSGVVKNSGNINLNPRKPHYATLQLLDYKTFLSEGETLNFVLEGQTISEAIQTLIDQIEGFEVGEILLNEDVQIGAYNCDNKTIYDVLEYLAEITGARWFTRIFDEHLVLIDFYSPNLIPDGEGIEYTQEYFRNNNIVDISYSYNASNYRNKQVITGDNIKSSLIQQERIIIAEDTNTYDLTYPIAEIVTIKNGNVEYSFDTQENKSLGSTANFYYKPGSNEIEAASSLKVGYVFVVSYYPYISSRQVIFNESEINRINESTGRTGIIERYEKRTDTNSNEDLNRIAQTYLDFKGGADITLKVKTYNKDIFRIGTQIFFNGPLESLTTKYLVAEKQIDMITTGEQQEIFYTYKLSSNYNYETAINYFNNQRRKLGGNIKEGEYITRNIDIPGSINIIFYDNSTSEIEIPNDILDGELDIELIGQNTHSAKLEARLEFKL